ncbi:MAG: hypothetical protein UHO11_03195 [Treponema sp.]|nr:hypothetical protein [Treponema sp.]
MKKFIYIALCAIFASIYSLSIMSCDSDDDSSTSYILPSIYTSGSSVPQKPTTAPTAPEIPTGIYGFAYHPNIIVSIDKEAGTCVATKFANYDSYKRTEAGNAGSSDIVSTKTGEVVWVFTGLSWVNAYKITVDDGSEAGLVRYIYGNSNYFNAYEIESESSGTSYSSVSTIDSFKAIDTTKWVIPADGKYVSESKVKISEEDKYLYAVVSNSGKTITFYKDSTNTVTDPSTLTIYDTVSVSSYDFYSNRLSIETDNWIIDTPNNMFRAKQTSDMSSFVKLISLQ